MNIQMEETQTASLRTWGREVACPLWGATHPAPRVFTNSKALWTLSFWAVMGASLPRHKWWDHPPLVIDPTSSLAPCPGNQKLGPKFPTQVGAHSWGMFQKSPCNIAKDLKKYIFIYLAVLGLCCGIRALRAFFVAAYRTGSLFCCSMWVLVLWPAINPGPPTLGAWRLSHWTTREVPTRDIFVDLVTSEIPRVVGILCQKRG